MYKYKKKQILVFKVDLMFIYIYIMRTIKKNQSDIYTVYFNLLRAILRFTG